MWLRVSAIRVLRPVPGDLENHHIYLEGCLLREKECPTLRNDFRRLVMQLCTYCLAPFAACMNRSKVYIRPETTLQACSQSAPDLSRILETNIYDIPYRRGTDSVLLRSGPMLTSWHPGCQRQCPTGLLYCRSFKYTISLSQNSLPRLKFEIELSQKDRGFLPRHRQLVCGMPATGFLRTQVPSVPLWTSASLLIPVKERWVGKRTT